MYCSVLLAGRLLWLCRRVGNQNLRVEGQWVFLLFCYGLLLFFLSVGVGMKSSCGLELKVTGVLVYPDLLKCFFIPFITVPLHTLSLVGQAVANYSYAGWVRPTVSFSTDFL